MTLEISEPAKELLAKEGFEPDLRRGPFFAGPSSG